VVIVYIFFILLSFLNFIYRFLLLQPFFMGVRFSEETWLKRDVMLFS